MYLTCPECYTSFVVQASQIGPKGRRVRCSRCSHGWFAPPAKSGSGSDWAFSISNSDRVGKPVEKFQTGINLPALLPIRIPAYLYITPILLALAIFFTSMVLFQDKLPLFGVIGTSKSLKVHDISIAYDKDHRNIIANYKIVNESSEAVPLAPVRIRLLDKNHRTLKSHIASESKSSLAPKQFVTIRTRFSESPTNVEFIDITLGSKLDLLLR